MKGLSRRRGDGPSTTRGQVGERPCPRVVPDESFRRLIPTNGNIAGAYNIQGTHEGHPRS